MKQLIGDDLFDNSLVNETTEHYLRLYYRRLIKPQHILKSWI